jgi:hypothetical protein
MSLKRNYGEDFDSLPLYRPTDKNNEEYEVLLEYDLRREREKNAILE